MKPLGILFIFVAGALFASGFYAKKKPGIKPGRLPVSRSSPEGNGSSDVPAGRGKGQVIALTIFTISMQIAHCNE